MLNSGPDYNSDSDSNIYNFSPGPAVLPQAVHQKLVQDLQVRDGIPLLELGHRTPQFDQIAAASEDRLRELLHIPQDYAVLFLSGGTRSQYAAVPLNLASPTAHAAYFDTGYWSRCAMQEAQKYIEVETAATISDSSPYSLQQEQKVSPDAAYHHYVANETLSGFEFCPSEVNDGSLVSDMTSSLLTQDIAIKQHRLIYASAQKNFGIAGITLVIVARDQLGKAQAHTPATFNYTVQDKAGSRYTTPPVLPWYVCHLMLEWIKEEGGVAEMYERSIQRSHPIYQCIDQSAIYQPMVAEPYRSRLNIAFRIEPHAAEAAFLEKAEAQGLLGLKGHSAVGGIRASLYNGMPQAGADALREFMEEFERTA